MKKFKTKEGEIEFWRQKLDRYKKEYNQLRKQSPARWWHDEHFDIQMRVLETLIFEAKERIRELKKDEKD